MLRSVPPKSRSISEVDVDRVDGVVEGVEAGLAGAHALELVEVAALALALAVGLVLLEREVGRRAEVGVADLLGDEVAPGSRVVLDVLREGLRVS